MLLWNFDRSLQHLRLLGDEANLCSVMQKSTTELPGLVGEEK